MNQKKFIKVLGTATVLAAFGLVACGDDTSSGPNAPDEITSSETAPSSDSNILPSSSESKEKPTSSSAIAGSSSSAKKQCEAFSPECGYTLEELCSMGYAEYCTGSSSSATNPNSSSSLGKCLSMPHFDDSLQIAYQVPVCTAEEEGTRLPDCETSDVYVCENGRWNTVADETCRHITDTGDPMKPHPCDVEFDVAMDCAKNYYMMCAGGIWLNATGCDTTKEKCGFDDYKLCSDYQLRAYCSDDWLNEPCEEGRSRDLRIYDTTDSTSFSYVNYICVEGKWVKRSSLYSNCDNDKDCLGGFQGCWQSEIIGQPCDERDPETSWITEDRCDFVCRDGKYEFMPPPTK